MPTNLHRSFMNKRKRPISARGAALLVLTVLSLSCDSTSGFLLSASKLVPAAPLSLAKPQRSAKPSNKVSLKTSSSKKQAPKSNKKQTPKKSTKQATPGSAATPSSNARSPPWQVLSQKDAKKNVEKEKLRRERIKLGLGEEDTVQEDVTVSHAFLDPVDRSFLGWKRFNPSSTSSGMKMVASVLGKKLPPRLGVPEVAFLGRSNVGKSSLLNRLSSYSKREIGFNDEARVGKTPGATASVNLYAFYDKKGEKPLLGFVDLPGFGYAKLSKDVKESVQQTAENYLGKREELVLGILLVDIRREPSEDDRIVLAALFDMGVPIVVVATKVDKISNNEIDNRLEYIREGLGLPEGQPLSVSSVTGDGTKALWNIIFEACETGVEEFRERFERGASEESEEEEQVFLPGNDEEAYSQGYDWVQDQFDDEDDFQEQDTRSVRRPEEDFDMTSIKDLRRLAKKLEKNKQI